MSQLDDPRCWWFALNGVANIGAVRFVALVRKFGSPQAVFEAPRSALAKIPDIGEKVIAALSEPIDEIECRRQVEQLDRRGARLLTILDSDYPLCLKKIYDPPPFLIVKGELRPGDESAVALVGSRAFTDYGRQVTELLGRELCAAGVTVVSGLASGIDSIAHKAAISSGGRTIGVLGCGLDTIYPPENKSLYEDVAANGAVITEFPFETKPEKFNFPSRNRIIAGLSRGVVVIEARKGSGALITAKHAMDQNREVFAVPGNILHQSTHGTNELLKQGAIPVTQTADILLALGLHPQQRREPPKPAPSLPEAEQAIYDRLSDQPQLVDSLSVSVNRPVQEVLSLLLSLEMAGLVRQLPGKQFLRAV